MDADRSVELLADLFALSGASDTFALITLLCCAAGALTALVPNAKLRTITSPMLAAAALAMLIATVVTVQDALTSSIEPFALLFADGGLVSHPDAESLVSNGLGCWLASAALALTLLASLLRRPVDGAPVFD